MKKIILKLFVIIIGILILCFVFKYFFKYDLWNLFMIPLFSLLWNLIKSILDLIINLFT